MKYFIIIWYIFEYVGFNNQNIAQQSIDIENDFM